MAKGGMSFESFNLNNRFINRVISETVKDCQAETRGLCYKLGYHTGK